MKVNNRYLVRRLSGTSAPIEEWNVIEESDKAFKIQTLHYKGTQTFWELKTVIEADYTVIENLGSYVSQIGGMGLPFMSDPNQFPAQEFYTGTPPPEIQPTTTSETKRACKCGGNCACKKGDIKVDM